MSWNPLQPDRRPIAQQAMQGALPPTVTLPPELPAPQGTAPVSQPLAPTGQPPAPPVQASQSATSAPTTSSGAFGQPGQTQGQTQLQGQNIAAQGQQLVQGPGPMAQAQQAGQGQAVQMPPVDVLDTPEALVVVVDLAGFDEDDIQLNVDNDVLRIAASRTLDLDDEESLLAQERPTRLERQLQLPVEAEIEEAKAKYDDGVCRITLPKVEGERGRHTRIGFQ